ncbi:MAG: glycosyltransferase family 2 protein, partial [Aristaeellaceae bacterium]
MLQWVLEALSALCGLWLAIMLAYQLYLTVFGFRKKTKDYEDHAPESRFLVLVPAHNEERVIGDIIDNLNRMDYPRELYDFYIIADNCTDRTAEVARAAGAQVIETRKDGPDAPTGKPIALKKALDALGDYHKNYDLLMIFDADNLMDVNMFREVNSQYLDKGKPDLIQCYLGAKNKDGYVAWF